MRKMIPALACATVFFAVPVSAFAQLTANVALTSNYKFRGQDQDTSKSKTFKPAIQGGVDYAFSNGFYVGNWNSSVDWLDNNSIESDLYGGYKGDLGSGLTYDVGALGYFYPGAGSANTGELYGALAWSAFTLKYSHTVSKKYFGVEDGRNTGYLSLAVAQEIAPKLTLKASVGYTRFSSDAKNDHGAVRYIDYGLGLGYDLGDGFAVAGGVYGGNKRDSYPGVNKNRLIATVSKSL